MGGRKKKSICRECSKAKFPAISAAKLGHESCLVTAYRVLGVFNERDGYGATPIHYAARSGQLDCLQWLVTHSGISPVVAAKNGTTAAHDSAAMGHLSCLQFFLEKTKCSAQDRTNEGATILHMACRFGHVGVTRWLIEKGFSSPSEKGDNGVTPVHLCAAKNHLECMKYLTNSSKYLPNELTVHGATPVYFAAQEGSVDCLQWLIKYGEGDPSIFANDGMGPLHAAAQAGELECLKWLVQYGGVSAVQKAEDGATPMHFAAAGGQILCLRWLVDNGGSLMDRDDLGGTPLHDAAEQGQTEAVSFILQCGIEKDIPDNEGYTPIDLAKDNNHEDCMKLFYIKTPNLLNSIATQKPQNRASSTSAEEEMFHREKQKKFEKALLSKTTESEREDIWKKAKKNVPIKPNLPVSTDDTTYGSRQSKKRDSLDAHRLSLSMINDLVDDHVNKDRPALSPNLFVKPDPEKEINEQSNDEVIEEPMEVEITMETISHPKEEDAFIGLRNDNFETDGSISIREINKSKHNNGDVDKTNEVDVSPYDEFFSQNDDKDGPVDRTKPISSATILSHQSITTTPPTTAITNTKIPPPNTTNTHAVRIGKHHSDKEKMPSGWKGLFKRFNAKKTKQPTATIPFTTTVSNDSQKNHLGQADKVVLRHKKPPTGSQVFTRVTSTTEEYAIVTHKRLSTNDDEVAVQFEKRQLEVRQSTLSTNSMSSPESSADEMDHMEDNDDDTDIFKPISKTRFDKFGKSLTEETNSLPNTEQQFDYFDDDNDGAVLAERGSLASMDTMVIHEDVDSLSEEIDGIEETHDSHITGDNTRLKPSLSNVSERKNVYNEPILIKPSASPKRDKRMPLLISSISEEEEEEEEEEDTQDPIAPLPKIHTSSSSSKNITENQFTLDGRESPETKRKKHDNSPPVIQYDQSANHSSPSATSGMRSFALVKQMYETKNTTAEHAGFSRVAGQKRSNTPVYSPLMIVATASPRVSLTSVKEEVDSNNIEEESSNDPIILEPLKYPEETRISLTPSQEAAFDNLERIKNSLNVLEKKEDNLRVEENNANHKEAMRTSPAVEELFDMIKGLDDLIKSKSQETSSEECSLSGSEIQSLVSTPRQPIKNDLHDKIKEMNVNVEIDGYGILQVTMKRNSLVISLIFRAAEVAGLALSTNHALFEVHNSLKIERPLEDHERIDEIVTKWPKKNPPHFHLHTYHEKYLLWEDNPLPKGYVGQFLKQGKVPNISSPLHFSRGGGGRAKWYKSIHCLGSLGIYLISTSEASSNMDLVCATDQSLFLPLRNNNADWAKYRQLPSQHCFIMKPTNSWREKDLKIFCCEDYSSLIQWISGIRLVKYGLQLKCNYVAMKKRLDQQQQQRLNPATTLLPKSI